MPLRRLPQQTVLPSLQKSDIQQNSYNTLLGQASTLAQGASQTPDGETFAKVILDRVLHGADAEYYLGQINTLANDYMANYSKDPYYAFTKKGKNQVKTMQQIVNDPSFKVMEETKKVNDAEYERVAKEGLQNSFIFDDYGNIAVFDGKTGQRRLINPEDFNPDEHMVLDITSDYELIERVDGSTRRAAYDIDSLENVTADIKGALTDLGVTKWRENYNSIYSYQDIGMEGGVPVNVSVERESNASQINGLVNQLKNRGLSPTAIKTLKSQYFRLNPADLGKEGANDRASEWIGKQIDAIANGQRVETSRPVIKDAVGIGSGSGDALDDQVTISGIFSGQHGWKQNTTLDEHGNLVSDGKSPEVPITYLKDAANPFEDPVTGAKNVENLNVMTNPWFQSGDKNNIQMAVVKDSEEEGGAKSGDYRNIPFDMIADGTIKYDPKPGSIVTRYVDATDKIISSEKYAEITQKAKDGELSEEEIARYIQTDAEGNGTMRRQAFLNTKVVLPRSINLWGSSPEEKVRAGELKDAGYKSSEQYVEEYMRHSGKSLDRPGGWKIDDEAFVVDIMLPLSEGSAAGLTRLWGEGVLTEKHLNKFENLKINQLKSVNLGKVGTNVKDKYVGYPK